MHKLRLRTRSTATASSHSHSNNAEEAGGSSAAPSVFGRSSTSTSISTSGRSSSDVKGKGKEKSNGASNAGAGHHGGGLKASLRGITGSADRKNTKKSVQEASNDKERADSLSASQLRPQLTLPTDNDFRASLILVSSLHCPCGPLATSTRDRVLD